MKYLFSAMTLSILTLPSAIAQTEWVKISNYKNYPPYSTNINARLMESRWDSSANSKIVLFQINLEGKDVGAMEFEAICRTGYFLWETKIQVPTTGVRYFSSRAVPQVQKAKATARDLFCKQ